MSDSAEDIRRQMQDLRRSATDEMKEFVDSAKTLTDWRYHVKHHPWICMGAAVALGYFVVPRKRQVENAEARELAALLKKYNVGVTTQPQPPSKGIIKSAIGAAIPFIARSALNVAQQRFAAGGGIGSLLGGGQREPQYEEFKSPR